MGTVAQVLIMMLSVYLLLLYAFIATRLYEKLLFYPFKDIAAPPSIEGAEVQVLTFEEAHGTQLSGWLYKLCAGDSGLILMSHGNAGNIMHRVELARRLVSDTGCSIFLYDYQGYGASQGSPSVKGILRDGIAAFDFAVEKLEYKSEQIIVYGESLGCAVAAYIASQRQARAIILQSPFRSLPAIARDVFNPLKMLPGIIFPEPHLNTEELLKTAHAPLLILHGKSDEVIPYRHGESLHRVALEPKTFVCLASRHNDTYVADRETFDRSVRDFVASLC